MIRPVLMLGTACAVALCTVTDSAYGQLRKVNVTVTNLAPTNSISFAPLHVGFHQGLFDAFNINQAPTAGIISVAEGGSGTQWQADFAAADPTATRSTIGGLLTPGATASLGFIVNSSANPFFTFASMVVPSNDFFIGNDNPIRVFDDNGNLIVNTIFQTSSQIWDAGSEVFDPAAAAFVGNNDLRTPQNGVVTFNFAELAGFNGLTTGAGYEFQSQLTSGQNVYRIDITAAQVPEPGNVGLLLAAVAAAATLVRRHRTSRMTA